MFELHFISSVDVENPRYNLDSWWSVGWFKMHDFFKYWLPGHFWEGLSVKWSQFENQVIFSIFNCALFWLKFYTINYYGGKRRSNLAQNINEGVKLLTSMSKIMSIGVCGPTSSMWPRGPKYPKMGPGSQYFI